MDATRDQPADLNRGPEGADAHDGAWRTRRLAPLVISVTGIALSVAFLPLLFNQAPIWDDEGSLLVMLREFIKRGSLYHHTSGYYGPFYYSLFGGLYRLFGAEPTAYTGRLIVLFLTGLGAAIFAGVVYRLTRSLAAAVLCEVASFCTLIKVAGTEPMHPAPLLVVLLGLLVYCLASNTIRPRPILIAGAGFTLAALVLTKVNVGGFAVLAVGIWLVLGNRETPKAFRVVVFVAATGFSFVLMVQNLSDTWAATYALTVGMSLLLVCVVARSGAPLPNGFKIVPFGAGALAAVVVSVPWPLLHGTSLPRLVYGVFIRPANQANALTRPPELHLSWPLFVIAAIGIALAALWREPRFAGRPIREEHWTLVLGLAGLGVLGLGAFGSFISWLPIIVLIPALALFVKSQRVVASFLVLTTAIAILQALHAYPVAGSQIGWSTVAMFIPCTIAVGVALRGSADWTRLGTTTRTTATAAACSFLVIAAGLWPYGAWHDYLKNPPLQLPGTSLVRLDPDQTDTLRTVTAYLAANCDTFYSAPPSDSFYIYTRIPPPTGLVIDWWGVLDTKEQQEIVDALSAAVIDGKRVCILRETTSYSQWAASSTGAGPLGQAVSAFNRNVAEFGNYSIWVRGS